MPALGFKFTNNFTTKLSNIGICYKQSDNFVPYLAQGVRHAFQDVGIRTLPELHEALVSGKLRMQIRSQSSIIEGGVHDLYNVQKNPM